MLRQILFLLVLCLMLPLTVLAQETISIGDTVEGVLDNDNTEVRYVFEGELGRFVTITLISNDSGVDPYLRLLDADGDLVAEDDDSAGSLNARISGFQLPANGEYTIVATTLNGRGDGDFELTLASQEVNRVEFTQQIEGELTTADPENQYRFTGRAGDFVVIQLTTEESDLDVYLRLASADSPGTDLITDDDSLGYPNAQIGPYELPETGEYVIFATSRSGSDVGEFNLTINRIEITPIEIGGSAEGEIRDGATAFFQFEGTAGQAVSISVNSDDTVDTRLAVRGPDNYEIASDDDSGGRVDPEIASLVLTDDGTYNVWVEPYSAGEEGVFTLEIEAFELPSLDAGAQQVRVSDKQRQHVLTFTGNADETVRLSIVVDDGGVVSPSITVTQDGTTVSYNSSSYISEIAFTFVVPADGTVNVQIDDYTYELHTLTVTLQRLNDE